MNPPVDSSFYTEGAKRMIAEGMEAVSKIMAFVKENETRLKDMSSVDRKKAILEFEPSKLFNQIHPIVFQYLAVEGIFSAVAFRRYITSVYGKPKSKEDEERLRSDRKYGYYFKNAQYALYYKYLLFETNPNVKTSVIHGMYEDMLSALNADTDHVMKVYEKAQEDAKCMEDQLTEQKRKDLVSLLKIPPRYRLNYYYRWHIRHRNIEELTDDIRSLIRG